MPQSQPHQIIPAPILRRLRTAKHYLFDLDDTLHSFRAASSTATKAVLNDMLKQTQYTLEDLQTSYKTILAHSTAAAFVEGKSSHHYRAERFQQLARLQSIPLGSEKLQGLVDLYERVLMQSLELKPGVMELFAVLKRYGKGIAIVTEGPQDAQERTVEALGLATRIDYLATTNRFGVAKVDGLFERVVEELGIGAGEVVVVVGDSWERDVLPAAKAGAFCVHYGEGVLKGGEIAEGWRVGRLEELRVLVEAAHSEFEIQSDP
ncbi:hypothetical protein G6514_009582 [Epicoccum nigrum]|nr:hypothetical protein G6514_009582 [Epicoccum nigrum]